MSAFHMRGNRSTRKDRYDILELKQLNLVAQLAEFWGSGPQNSFMCMLILAFLASSLWLFYNPEKSYKVHISEYVNQ